MMTAKRPNSAQEPDHRALRTYAGGSAAEPLGRRMTLGERLVAAVAAMSLVAITMSAVLSLQRPNQSSEGMTQEDLSRAARSGPNSTIVDCHPHCHEVLAEILGRSGGRLDSGAQRRERAMREVVREDGTNCIVDEAGNQTFCSDGAASFWSKQ